MLVYVYHILVLYIPLVSTQDWDQPEYIADPDAKIPEDWDEDMDGEWEPPMVPNPDYKVGRASYHDNRNTSSTHASIFVKVLELPDLISPL